MALHTLITVYGSCTVMSPPQDKRHVYTVRYFSILVPVACTVRMHGNDASHDRNGSPHRNVRSTRVMASPSR